jgi:arylsulfatase
VIGITPPKVVDGFVQDPIDGVSLAYTFADAQAPTRKKVQYFDNNGSRAIYQDGWVAGTFGPLVPWLPGAPGLAEWDSAKDKWELYDIRGDFSQAKDLAAAQPQRLAALRKAFDAQAEANKVYPLGAGIWLRLHPEDRIKSPYTSWTFDTTTTRMPEFTAPGLGRENSVVTIDAEVGPEASGVLYALGGSGGGVALYMDRGSLVYDYNMMIIERYVARATTKVAPGKRRIEVTTTLASAKPLAPAEVVIKVDGAEVARTTVKRTVPAAFSASETFDVGVDLGSTVSLDYFERRPFRFEGTIRSVGVRLQ